jgi:hypothetical protein
LRLHPFTGAALDRAIDVVVRHALRAGRLDGAAQARISGRIPAARFRRNRDLFGKLAEKIPALGVDRALEPFHLGPLTVSGHGCDLVSLT